MGGGRGLMKRSFLVYAVLLMIAVFAFIFGCEKTFIGLPEQNKSPEVWLSSGPVEGTTTGYQVHFYWGGWDPDGESEALRIRRGRRISLSDSIARIRPGSTNGRKTSLHDSVFRVTADDTAAADDPSTAATRTRATTRRIPSSSARSTSREGAPIRCTGRLPRGRSPRTSRSRCRVRRATGTRRCRSAR